MSSKFSLKNIGGLPLFSLPLLLCLLFPADGFGAMKTDQTNAEKVKYINQVLRNLLKEKKTAIRVEDVFSAVSGKIPLDDLASGEKRDESTRKYYTELEKQLKKEARSKYPVYLMGDYLVISGDAERAWGRYNKKDSRGIWIGFQMIPWSDIAPECAAQFNYKDAVRVRNNYVKSHFGSIEVDGKWTTVRKYITDKVNSARTTFETNVPDGKLELWLICLAGCIVGWMLAAMGGKARKRNAARFGLVGCLIGGIIGFVVGSPVSKMIRIQRIDKTVESILETIADPAEKEAAKYRFYKVEEKQTAAPQSHMIPAQSEPPNP